MVVNCCNMALPPCKFYDRCANFRKQARKRINVPAGPISEVLPWHTGSVMKM